MVILIVNADELVLAVELEVETVIEFGFVAAVICLICAYPLRLKEGICMSAS